MPFAMATNKRFRHAHWRAALCGIFPVVLVALGSIAGADEPADAIRATIDRGLAFVTKDALTWKEQRKCASCHHAPMAIWSLNEAKKRGYAIDEKAAAELTAWVSAKEDPAKVYAAGGTQTEIIVNQTPLMLALGVEAGEVKDEATRADLTKMLSALLEKQRPDGSWGLLYVWEPIGTTPDIITSLVLLSLTAPNAVDLGPPGKEAREKGLAWLSAEKPAENLQSWAIRLLLWKRLARPAADLEPLVKQIIGKQNPDGGWSQFPDAPSDAYATGQTLYALAEAGLPSNDSAIAKGQAFLVGSQDSTGSWPMASRPGGPGGKSAKNVAPIQLAGTAWAVMGLVRSTPRAESPQVSAAQ